MAKLTEFGTRGGCGSVEGGMQVRGKRHDGVKLIMRCLWNDSPKWNLISLIRRFEHESRGRVHGRNGENSFERLRVRRRDFGGRTFETTTTTTSIAE